MPIIGYAKISGSARVGGVLTRFNGGNIDSRIQFNSLLDHVRTIVAGAEMFDPRDRRKIVTKADKLWTDLRNARKRQLRALDGPSCSRNAV